MVLRCFKMCSLQNILRQTDSTATASPVKKVFDWHEKENFATLAHVVEEHELDWTHMFGIFPSSKTQMKAMCLKHIFDHSDVFLEIQTFPGKRKCEGKLVSRIRFDKIFLYWSPAGEIEIGTAAQGISAHILLQPLMAMLINVQMQPTFQGGTGHYANPPPARVSGCSPVIRKWCSWVLKDKNIPCRTTRYQKFRMSVCYGCVLLCVSGRFWISVPSGEAYSYQPCWPLLHLFLSPQVPTSGPALVDRPRPLQIMRTLFTHW